MPQLDRPHRNWWRVIDERSGDGGRVKAWLYLTHPGPSLLVTALVVAAAALLARQAPPPRTVVGLVLLMLPAQLAIGALNDWADVAMDAAAKPYKPIPRGVVPRAAALALAIGGLVTSLAAAASMGVALLGADLLVVGAGVSYDLALKRTPAAALAWWGGFVAVPLVAMLATGRLHGALAVIPLAGLMAVALQVANGLPDVEGDLRGGARTLPVVLGPRGSRALMALGLGVASAYTAALQAALGQGAGALVAAGLLAAGALLAAIQRSASRATFPALAVILAVATVSWLAALPPAAPA